MAHIMRQMFMRMRRMGPLGAMKKIRARFILSSSKIFIRKVCFFYLGFGRIIEIRAASMIRPQE